MNQCRFQSSRTRTFRSSCRAIPKPLTPRTIRYAWTTRTGGSPSTVKKQSLAAVLDRLASVLGVNLTMKQDTNDTVDLDFKEASLEDAIGYFPPSVHLHVRKDIQHSTTMPLLIEFAN